MSRKRWSDAQKKLLITGCLSASVVLILVQLWGGSRIDQVSAPSLEGSWVIDEARLREMATNGMLMHDVDAEGTQFLAKSGLKVLVKDEKFTRTLQGVTPATFESKLVEARDDRTGVSTATLDPPDPVLGGQLRIQIAPEGVYIRGIVQRGTVRNAPGTMGRVASLVFVPLKRQ